jgi:hypothetical protein
MRVLLFHGDGGGDFGTAELDSLRASADPRDTYVYADRILIDEEEAESYGILVLQLPYDLPIPAV